MISCLFKFILIILIVTEYKKRKAEELVRKAMMDKLPKLGEKGTILDYKDAYEDPEQKNSKLDGDEHYPFYQQGAEGVDLDLQKQWEEYYANGGTPEAAAAYYAQMGMSNESTVTQNSLEDYERAKYGYSQQHYESSEAPLQYSQSEYDVGNEAYAVSNESYAIPSETPQKIIEENVSKTLIGLVGYASDEDE